jgi:hypothetical protein
VVYRSTGFLDKNRDQLDMGLLDIITHSNSEFLKNLFPQEELDSKTNKQSLTTKFRKDLKELMAALNLTAPNYVRCIKSNPNKQVTLRLCASVSRVSLFSVCLSACLSVCLSLCVCSKRLLCFFFMCCRSLFSFLISFSLSC